MRAKWRRRVSLPVSRGVCNVPRKVLMHGRHDCEQRREDGEEILTSVRQDALSAPPPPATLTQTVVNPSSSARYVVPINMEADVKTDGRSKAMRGLRGCRFPERLEPDTRGNG
eukprot:scaffold312846_cov30-Tisochrysis_lutea.AAC.2